MRKILITTGIIVIVALVGFFAYKTFVGYRNLLNSEPTPSNPAGGQQATSSEQNVQGNNSLPDQGQTVMTPALDGKSIAMIIAFDDFKDEELFNLRNLFLVSGSKVKIISTQLGEAQGILGNKMAVDILLKDLQVKDFDAIVLIGGSGALSGLDNQDTYRVAKDAVSQGKVLAAISISPEILAKSGVLTGKKATVWTSQSDKSAVQVLEANGAIFQNQAVVTDGKIITGSGPEAVDEFGITLIDVLLFE